MRPTSFLYAKGFFLIEMSISTALERHDKHAGHPMMSEQARLRAEKHFKVQESTGGSRDYEEQARATRSKMARLRTLRLARDAVLFRRFREVPKSAK